jgi:hypothetical protein
MRVKFLFGYSGRETAMKTYDVDDIAELDHQAAIELIRLGVVEEVEDGEPIHEVVVKFLTQTTAYTNSEHVTPKKQRKGRRV